MQTQPTDPVPHQPIWIELGDRRYPIWIGKGLIAAESSYGGLSDGSDALIVSNATVAPLYAQQVATAIQRKFRKVHTVVLPDGEAFKTAQTIAGRFDYQPMPP